MSNEYITAEEYINANRSPPLRPTQINYRSTETPPPLVDIDLPQIDSIDTVKTSGEGRTTRTFTSAKGRPQPSLCDSLLLKQLGPDYPEIAFKAAREFLTPSPDSPWEDRKPDSASTEGQMVYDRVGDASSARTGANMLAVAAYEASYEASQKLNAAIEKDRGVIPMAPAGRMSMGLQDGRSDARLDNGIYTNGGHHNSLGHRQYVAPPESPLYPSPKPFNVKPPPRTCLPPIKTNSPAREASVPGSATLAKFNIPPIDHISEQQLPRMHVGSTTVMNGAPLSSKQTLPSLETALSALATPSESVYSGRSPSLTRPSPGQLSHLGPSPSTHSNPSPASGISPPRLSSAPVYWRTISRETSDSTPSDYASVAPSIGISTPASSAPALSPAESAHTPSAAVHDSDPHHMSHSLTSGSMPGTPSEIDVQYKGPYCGGSFKCTWPGCDSSPFQTQYLLNSHANVHSTTRPHFCSVQGCNRGPGGQGFKRKNEMISNTNTHDQTICSDMYVFIIQTEIGMIYNYEMYSPNGPRGAMDEADDVDSALD